MLNLYKQGRINMKKIILVLLCLLMISGCCKKKTEIKSIDELISYKVVDYYKKGGHYYIEDTKVKIEQDYYSLRDGGYFQIELFSYKDHDVFGSSDETIDLDEYINALNKKEELIIDDHTFYLGYRNSEEVENVNARAYVRHNDYVIEFLMSNSDELLEDYQYEDFKEMLKSIKFK